MERPVQLQGAAAATRSLFELYLDIKTLSDDKTVGLAEKYHAFTKIERFRVNNNVVSFFDNHPEITGVDLTKLRDDMKTYDKKYIDKIIIKNWGSSKNNKPKLPKHWTGKNDTRKRARDLGVEYERIYVTIYPYLSWHIHSGSVGYAGLNEEEVKTLLWWTHSISKNIFLNATEICVREMGISKAINGFDGIINNLRHM